MTSDIRRQQAEDVIDRLLASETLPEEEVESLRQMGRAADPILEALTAVALNPGTALPRRRAAAEVVRQATLWGAAAMLIWAEVHRDAASRPSALDALMNIPRERALETILVLRQIAGGTNADLAKQARARLSQLRVEGRNVE